MNVTVAAQGFPLTAAIDAHTRNRLAQALRHYRDSMVSVSAYLRDVNGPKGGIDKEVFVGILLRNGHVISIETVHTDLYAAILRSARRAKRAVRRALDKDRRLARRELRKLRVSPAGPELV